MTYVALALYSMDTGQFQGYVIKDVSPQVEKLQSTNVWQEGEEDNLTERLARLNDQSSLNRHWPHPQDPEVQALVNDPDFCPIEYEEQDVIDDEKSHYVYKQIAGGHTNDPRSGPAWIDSDEVDKEASTIVTKKALVPKRPTDVMLRIKRACEQVARQRAGLL